MSASFATSSGTPDWTGRCAVAPASWVDIRDQFAAEIAYFSDCVMNGNDPEPGAEEGCRDIRVVRALYQSAGTGMPVTLRDFGPEDPPVNGQRQDIPPVMREPELVAVEKPHD